VVVSTLAVADGVWLTPTIATLHAQGAVRGVGEAGLALSSAHDLAEQSGKAQALLAIVLVGLHVFTLATRSARSERATVEPASA
jgi:hypothetical protein